MILKANRKSLALLMMAAALLSACAPGASPDSSVELGSALATDDVVLNAAAVAAVASTPYGTAPFTIPGVIPAAQYDKGGEGVAYHDMDPANVGGKFRNDGVDIKVNTDAGGGYAVGWFQTGEYLRYTVNVSQAGLYRLSARVASAMTTGRLHVEVDGVNLSKTMIVPNTGAWDTNFANVAVRINLPAGRHVLTVVSEAEFFDFASLTFTLISTPTPTPSPSPSPTPLPASTIGPIIPVGTQATVACTGVKLAAGASLQAAVNANPVNTTFCLAPGLYARQSIIPKSGQKFIGAKGAILDGQKATRRAFDGAGANVTIQNLVITNYTAGNQDAAVFAGLGTNWVIRNNEISYNAGIGIHVGVGVQVRGNFIHHNAQAGYGSPTPFTAPVIDSNEIAFNNYQDAFEPGFEAGGGKLSLTNGAMITHNYSHDNHGPGLWTDIDNRNTTYAYNRVENNQNGGIFHEISYSASIHHNSLKNNASVYGGWLWNANIQISSSGGEGNGMIEIYENTVVTNSVGNGIGIMQQNRDADDCSYGRCLVRNVYVHHNTVDLSKGGATGVVQDTGDTAIFTSRNVRLDYNTYIQGSNANPFAFSNQQGNKSVFLNAGQEAHGIFK